MGREKFPGVFTKPLLGFFDLKSLKALLVPSSPCHVLSVEREQSSECVGLCEGLAAPPPLPTECIFLHTRGVTSAFCNPRVQKQCEHTE